MDRDGEGGQVSRGAEDADESPVSLLQRNVTLYKSPRARGAELAPLRHVTERGG